MTVLAVSVLQFKKKRAAVKVEIKSPDLDFSGRISANFWSLWISWTVALILESSSLPYFFVNRPL